MSLVRAAFAAPAAAVATTLRNRALGRVTLAFFIYNAVELGAWTGILVYAYSATGPASVGIVAVVQLVPAAIVAPVLAAVGDRYPRHRALLAAYGLQAAGMAIVGAAMLSGIEPLGVYVASLIAVIVFTLTRPLQSSLLPSLADTPDELTAGNALSSIGEGVGALVGPLALGAILVAAGPGEAFLAFAGAMLVGALLVSGIRPHADVLEMLRGEGAVRDAPASDPASEAGDAIDDTDRGSVLEGIRTVVHDPDLIVVMALLTGRLVLYGGLEVLIVLVALDLLMTGEPGVGFLMAALGIGGIVGGVSGFAIVGRRRITRWLAIGAMLSGLQLAVLGIIPSPASATVLLIIGGIGLSILEVAGQTLLQRITTDDVRARVFGVLESLLLLGEALGSILVVPIVLVLGIENALIVLGLVLPAITLPAALRFTRIDARAEIAGPEIAALRSLPMFALLAPPTLESLARQLRSVPLPGGTAVIREGDPGDAFYVIREGRVRVSVGGQAVRELGPGEAFGEIALLHDVPRTASVTAIADVALYALDRPAFLAAITGDPAALAEARRMAAARVG